MAKISELTKDELLSEEVILAMIVSETDPVEQAKVTNEMTDRAKLLGCVAAFKDMVKAVKKAAKASGRRSVRSTDFTMPTINGIDKYDQLRCGEWDANDNGVYTTNVIGQVIEACPHPILPVKLLRNAQEDKVKVVLAYKRAEGWRELTVDKSVTASASKIVGLADYGIQVTTENGKALVRYLNDVEAFNPDLIKFYVSTSKLGWTAAGEFMPYAKNIIFDAENSVASVYQSIEERGSFDDWIAFVKRVRAMRKVEVQLYMAAAFASPFVSKLGLLPFIVDLYGETGNGKTVAAMLATSIWANPEVGKYITKAGGTLTSLEVYLDLLNDLPAVIDDFAQIKKQSMKGQVDFGEYVYMLCSGSSKGRSNVALGLQRSRTWRNIIITNSEQSLITDSSRGGMINRIIEYESDDIIFPGDMGHKTAEFVKNNYGYAGRFFLSQIDTDELRVSWQHFNDWLASKSESTGDHKEEKQILPMALLLAIDKAVTDIIFKDGIYLDQEVAYGMLKDHEAVSDMERAYNGMTERVVMNRSAFEKDSKECWGKFSEDNSKVYIIRSAFEKLCKDIEVTPSSFLRWLARSNLIERGDTKNLTKNIRIESSQVRCVVLKMPADSGFMEVDECNDLPFSPE